MNSHSCVRIRPLLAVTLAITLCGCPKPETTTTDNSSVRQDIPLRVVLVGSQEEASAVERAWLAVSDQPVNVTATDAQTATNRLIEFAQQSDVLIYPASQTGELQKADAVRRLRKQFFDTGSSSDAAAERLLPALQQGVLNYGDESIGLPLGATQPVLLHPPTESDSPQRWTWDQFAERVATLESGQSAEPLADGWAAVALLNRANSYCGTAWLFSGDDLRPTLATAPYLRALRELQRDAAQYPKQRMTPAEVWQAVSEGQLQLAISWPTTLENSTTEADLLIEPLPTSVEVYTGKEKGWQPRPEERQDEWIFLMGDTPLASIAAGCRQTAASERFLRWLGGNEGTASLRESVPMFTATREYTGEAMESRNSSMAGYAKVLKTRMTISYVRPMLRIPAADQYMQALDREVIAVLEGNKTPEVALVDASLAWEKITDAHDRRLQAKHWRLTQGMNR